MISVRCGTCGAVYEKGTRCLNCQRQYNHERRDKKRAKFYRQKAWILLREKVKEYYCNIDMWILGLTGHITPCSRPIVHHIEPYEQHPELALTFSNLVCVSSTSHNYIHEWYADGKKLEAIAILEKGKERYEELRQNDQ